MSLDPILIVDPDPVFLDQIYQDPQAIKFPPLTAQTGKEAMRILSQYHKQRLAAVFINPDVTDPTGVALVRFSHRYHPGTPIYFLWDDSPISDATLRSETVLKSLGVQCLVPKPITYRELIKLVVPPDEVFDPNETIEKIGKHDEAINEYIVEDDSKFFSIRPQIYLSGAKSFFDVYVRLKSGRYLKILKAGDAFSALRVKLYIKQGATHFYLRKEAQLPFLNYCDKLVGILTTNPKVSIDLKVSYTLAQGEQTLKLIQEWGLDQESIQYAAGFIQNLNQIIKDLDIKNNEMIKSFYESALASEHGIGVSALAGLLARNLNFEFKDSVNIVGVASLFHDIGLDRSIREKEVFELDEREMNLYKIHPTAGRKILQEIPSLKPVILQAVEQHHERRDRTGFPNGIGGSDILQVAEMISVTNEFWHILWRKGGTMNVDPAIDVEVNNISYNYSPLVNKAFREVFITGVQPNPKPKKKK